MKKQIASTLALFFFFQTSFGQVPSINVSGANGRDGAAGRSYSTSSRYAGSGRGSNGQNGGHAGHSTPGQNAGQIEVNIQDKELTSGQSSVAIVEMDASFLTADGQTQKLNTEFSPGASGFMYLQANGGKGGDGGVGGDGQGGQNGDSGTVYHFTEAHVDQGIITSAQGTHLVVEFEKSGNPERILIEMPEGRRPARPGEVVAIHWNKMNGVLAIERENGDYQAAAKSEK